MSTVLAWLWTRLELSPLWRRITLRRHKSELLALRSARDRSPRSVIPIALTAIMWFFLLAGLPSLFLFLLTQGLASIGGDVAIVLATIAFVIECAFSLFAACLASLWLYRWYVIAAWLMVGNTVLADRKEAELVAAIAAAERAGVA